jgi:transposase-like protein
MPITPGNPFKGRSLFRRGAPFGRAAAVEALKAAGALPRRVCLRQKKYPNNSIEQDHRTVKK